MRILKKDGQQLILILIIIIFSLELNDKRKYKSKLLIITF